MSVHVRVRADGSKSYQARYRDHAGKAHARSFAKEPEARLWEAQHRVEIATGTWVDPRAGRLLLREFVPIWQTGRLVRSSTAEANRWYIDALILPAFGAMPLAGISYGDVQTWVAGLCQTHAPATATKALQLLRMIMRAAVLDRRIPMDPTAGVRLPPVHPPDIVPLTVDELFRLSEAMDPRFRPFVYLCGMGGLRIGEALGLDWNDVDLAAGSVRVTRTVVVVGRSVRFNPPKSRAGQRTVPVPKQVIEQLAAVRQPAGLVLAGQRGQPMRPGNFRRREFARAVAAAGVAPCTPHRLRHTAVSLWLSAGATPIEVASRAGHSSVSVVLDRYGHLIPGSDDRVTRALEEMFPVSRRRG